MKKKFVQLAACALAAALMLSLPAGLPRADAASASGERQSLSVGIYFGSSALPGVNIANQTGKGFRLGYYQDGDGQFVELARTSETDISIVKAMNVYLSSYHPGGNATYYDYSGQAAGSVVIGEYHLRLPGTYDSYEQAMSAASAYDGGFVSYTGGTFQARVGNYALRDDAVEAQSSMALDGIQAELCGSSSAAINVVRSGTNEILFQYDGAGDEPALGVEPNAAGDGGEDYTTRFHSIYWRGGFRFERIDGGNLTIVNMVDLEDYVKGVVPHEMSNSWPLEALKAQAVCARTYGLLMADRNRHSSGHFDICNESHCQVYLGTNGAGANSDRAVDETAGVTATYDGKYIEAVYYSSNGGASEDSSVVWGSNQSSYPYLIGVEDPYEAAIADRIDRAYSSSGASYQWTRQYTGSEIARELQERGYQCSDIVSGQISQYSDTGNPISVTLTDSAGKNFTITSRTFVTMMGLRSYHYDLSQGSGGSGQLYVNGQPVDSLDGMYAIDGSGTVSAIGSGAYVITESGTAPAGSSSAGSGVITVSGAGWGHNVGLSQWGAYAQAMEGRTYLQILEFYYTGITVG